jgi:long-subunit acyl-CoA synthetase (AMP-forming)/thioester reductase-like protein
MAVLNRVAEIVRDGFAYVRGSEQNALVLCRLRNDTEEFSFLPLLVNERPTSKNIALRCYLLRWSELNSCEYVIHLNGRCKIGEHRKSDVAVKHRGVYCNCCYDKSPTGICQPIQGMRYRCLSCDDFDSCDDCFHSLKTESICENSDHKYISFDYCVLELSELIAPSYSETLTNILLNFGDLPALGSISPSNPQEFVWVSYRELYTSSVNFGSGLRRLGLCAGDFVLICASNSIQYMICDIACGIYGYVVVGLSTSAAESELLGVIDQLDGERIAMVCCAKTLPTIRSLLSSHRNEKKSIQAIHHVIVLDGNPLNVPHSEQKDCSHSAHAALNLPPEHGSYNSHSFSDICAMTNIAQFPPQRTTLSSLVALAFTSGTTQGCPKGIPISVRSRMMLVERWVSMYQQMRVSREVAMVYTAFSYTASREELMYLLFSGGQAAIYTSPVNGVGEILRQMKVLRPTFVAAVPAFWIEVYNMYCAEIAELSTASNTSHIEDSEDKCKTAQVSHEARETTRIQAKYASLFGNRCISISTGSAHTPPAVYAFLKNIVSNTSLSPDGGLICDVYEGYGAMECGGIASNGRFFEGVEWRLDMCASDAAPAETADRTVSATQAADHSKSMLLQTTKELQDTDSKDDFVYEEKSGRDTTSSVGLVPRVWQGELLVRTARMISEYYQNPGLSADRITNDGYFRTGDLVELRCRCQLSEVLRDARDVDVCRCVGMGGPLVHVIGRSGAMLKLCDGEFFSPELVEGKLIQCVSIDQAYVYAEISWAFPVAVFVVEKRLFEQYSEDNLDKLLTKEMSDLVKEGQIMAKHLPQCFIVTTERFTVENGLLTVSEKKCRGKMKSRFLSAMRENYLQSQHAHVSRTVRHVMDRVLSSSTPASHDNHMHTSTDIWRRGLTSLSAISVANELSDKYQIPHNISLQMLLQSKDIDALSSHINEYKHQQQRLDSIDARGDGNSRGGISLDEWRNVALQDCDFRVQSGTQQETITPTSTRAMLTANPPTPEPTVLTTSIDSAIEISTDGVSIDFDVVKKKVISGVLLTGACGFLGSVLLLDLVEALESEVTIHVIIRKAVDNESVSVRKRLVDHLSQIDSSIDIEQCVMGRVHVLEGDLSLPEFDLDHDTYVKLCEDTSHVVHCAATTSWTASYYQLRCANVLSTQNIVAFCLFGERSRQLCHISSLSATLGQTAPPCNGDFGEYYRLTKDYINRSSISSGYAVSKSVAECVVRAAGTVVAKAVEITCDGIGRLPGQYGNNQLEYMIIRPGTISAHSKTGFSNKTDFTTRLIRSLLASRQVPDLRNDCNIQGRIDLACVDHISMCIRDLVVSGAYTGQTVHLSSTRLTKFSDIITRVADHLSSCRDGNDTACVISAGAGSATQKQQGQQEGGKMEYVAYADWLENVGCDESDALYPVGNDLLHNTLNNVEFDDIGDRRDTTIVQDNDHSCPVFDVDTAVPAIIKWLDTHNLIISAYTSKASAQEQQRDGVDGDEIKVAS